MFTNYFKFIKDGKYQGEDSWLNLIDQPKQRAMITTYGVEKNKYAYLVQNEVTLDDLFAV